MADAPRTTTDSGAPVESDEHSLTVGPGGWGDAARTAVADCLAAPQSELRQRNWSGAADRR